jgi:glycosyltransferase involved in cell wall biosynthesis
MEISVALCTYNGEKFVQKQLDSILNQEKYNVDEIVICDDKSNDSTIEIINKYKADYPQIIKLFQNETNLGSTKNFEKALTICQGNYIFLSDQDDIWKKNKIDRTLKIFNENSDCQGVFSNATLINEEDNTINEITLWDSIFFLEKELPKPIDFFDLIARNGNIVTGATLCIKKEVKNFIFPFSDNVLHDEWIAMLLSIEKRLFYSSENLISYRIHKKQQVGVKSKAKLKSIEHKKRIILGLKEPKNFRDYVILSKKKWLKIIKFERVKDVLENSDKLEKNCMLLYEDYIQFQKEIKQKFPIKYRLNLWIDKVRNKRNLKNI